jgi:hypothetical protein
MGRDVQLLLSPPFSPPCSIGEVLYNIDTSIQFGEDADVKTKDYMDGIPEEEEQADWSQPGGEDS